MIREQRLEAEVGTGETAFQVLTLLSRLHLQQNIQLWPLQCINSLISIQFPQPYHLPEAQPLGHKSLRDILDLNHKSLLGRWDALIFIKVLYPLCCLGKTPPRLMCGTPSDIYRQWLRAFHPSQLWVGSVSCFYPAIVGKGSCCSSYFSNRFSIYKVLLSLLAVPTFRSDSPRYMNDPCLSNS